ncbi:MAG: ABC transporter ATP-binding protein [Campylobacteraceae bacterium]|jgi:branched-chain amino acid transport system ATP-binding protein|nr:ABC transporter ATP-binding protein [Campylobacteraceae bacterium]
MILEIKSITKSFGGVMAISDTSFSVETGQIFGLIGPNGAGKTTMFNIITGNYKPTSGIVELDGEVISGLKPYQIVRKGIARTFQNIRLFSSMSVMENVLIGFDNHAKYTFFEGMFRLPRFFKSEREIKAKARKILEYLELEAYEDEAAVSLSYGQQRKVEIARALAANPKLLLLDEPAAGMNPAETKELATLLQRAKADFDLAILLIEHDMKFVNQLCDRVLVLDYGKSICEGTPAEVISHKDVVAAYLGDFTND